MKNNKNSKGKIIVWVIALIIVLIIFLPGLFENKKNLNIAQKEYQLIKEGKTISADTVANEVLKIFEERDTENLKNYLTSDFIYVNNTNYESKYVDDFWRDLKYYVGKNYIERRGNSIKDEETFWIYWDIPQELTYEQYSQYSLQKIFIYLRKDIQEDKITYKIHKMKMVNN